MRSYRWLPFLKREAIECPGGWDVSTSGSVQPATSKGSLGGQPLPPLGVLTVPAPCPACPPFTGGASHVHVRLVQPFGY